ncbi:MAG: MBL fold metallo-hydrolase [Dehalococcoidia bacterium]|nr:MBL fold metallo-hydrolase [Dehalococcoidia bacterium]
MLRKGCSDKMTTNLGNGMADVREVADKVYRFETPIAGMFYTPVVYLIDAPSGVLIEPGPAAAMPSIQKAMAQLGMKDLSYIIPTHIHVDHGGGAGALAKHFPNAKVVAHPRGAKHLASPERLVESTKLVWGQDFEQNLGPIIPIPESQLKAMEDGEAILIGDRQLQIIHALGHSPHHIVILDRRLNGLFCGEALGLPGHQLPPVAPYSFEQDAYMATIDSLSRLDFDALFYSHGSIEREPGRLMSRALENARLYSSIILETARSGNAPDDIMLLVSEDFHRRFGQRLPKGDLEILVAGYMIYFKSKGMLA